MLRTWSWMSRDDRCRYGQLGQQRSITAVWLVTLVVVTFGVAGCQGCPDENMKSGDDASNKVGDPPPRSGAYPPPNVASIPVAPLWKALQDSGAKRRLLVTLKDPSDTRGYFNGRVLIRREDYATEKRRLLESIPHLDEVRDRPITLASGATLPVFEATVGSQADLQRLRQADSVDFVEPAILPLGPMEVSDWLSCGETPYSRSSEAVPADDRLPGPYEGADLVPYAYRFHGVQSAWDRLGPVTRGRALPGADQGIAVLDTGLARTQQQFFERYSLYYPRRPLLRLNRTDEGEEDACSHGTKVASVAAAPRDGRSIVGIAYGAPLMAIKVTHNPLVAIGRECDPLELGACIPVEPASVAAVCQGIHDAVRPPDGRPPAKVVSMAFGLGYTSPTIQDCIANAFVESPNTLFVAAAGSGVPFVTFPASLDPYVIAVSMVEASPGGSYRLIGGPHTVAYGESVDFVAAYDSDSQLPGSGLVGDAHKDAISQFGLTSAATSIYTGLLALVSQYADEQRWTREQLMSALALASSREGIRDVDGAPPRAIIGAGILDVYRATGGARKATITAPTGAKPGTEAFLFGSVDAVVPPRARTPSHFKYLWTVNGGSEVEGPNVIVRAPEAEPFRVELKVVDQISGATLTASREIPLQVSIPSVRDRVLYWTSYVTDHPTFFNGGRHDRVVNAGLNMPDGCVVKAVRGVPMVRNDQNAIVADPSVSPTTTWDGGKAGFTVSRPTGLPGSALETLVHQWHDGLTAVRTKVVYDVLELSGVDCAIPDVLSPTP